MFLTHLKFAIRVFLKDKFFSILNILGLALGIAVSIILLLILQNDLSYDQHYANHNRIYRLGCDYHIPGMEYKSALSAREFGYILKDEFPEIHAITKVDPIERSLIKYEIDGKEKLFYEDHIIQTDSSYFQLFTHSFIEGDSETCLDDPHSAVITRSLSRKYFGHEDAINEILMLNGRSWKVTGVIEDLPENTHVKFDILISGLSVNRDWAMNEGQPISEAFWNPDVFIYLLVPDHYDPQDFLKKFPAIYTKYFKEIGDQVGGKYAPILQPLADIHFDSIMADDQPHGNIAYLYAFTGIGILIFILACINYMNLSTAKSVSRASEIALKKIVGSGKRALVLSILAESVLLSLISLLLAIGFVVLVLNGTSFNLLIGKNLIPNFFHNPLLIVGSLSISLGIGLLSGLYPAFYLSQIPVISSLKSSFKNKKSNVLFRKILITTQFAISICVVVCTLFMREQIEYVRNKDLGFTLDNVLVLPIKDTLVRNQIPVLKNELLQNTQIIAATTSETVMGMDIGSGVMMGESDTGMKQQGGVLVLSVGEDYLETMGLTLLSGRDFLPGTDTDTKGVYIANEAAVKAMGWGNDALGKKVSFFHGENLGHVVGVVKNFNSSSLHREIEPMLILKSNWFNGFMQVKLNGENLSQTIEYIKNKWARIDPNSPFEYFFLDQRFNEQYKADVVQNKLLNILSYICIFISLLGVFGLSAFSATERTKEIGVRKVLGAKVFDLIFLLSKEALTLVMLSSVFVPPISYLAINQWLENFAYRADLNYFVYLMVILAALCLVFLTVTLQSLRAANSNPVESLRYE